MVTLRILINFAARQYRRGGRVALIQRNPVDVLKDHWAKLGSRTDRYIDRRRSARSGKGCWKSCHPAQSRSSVGHRPDHLALLTGAVATRLRPDVGPE